MPHPRLSSRGRFIPVLFAIADILMVNMIFGIMCLLYPQTTSGSAGRMLWMLVNISLVPEIWMSLRRGLHRALQLDAVARQALCDVALHALFFLSTIAILYIDVTSMYRMALFYSIMLVGLLAERLLTRGLLKYYRRRGHGYARVVIVGANTTGMRLAAELISDAGFGYRMLGFFDDTCPEGFTGRYIGTIKQLGDYLSRERVHQVFYCRATDGSGRHAAKVLRIADDNGADFIFVPQLSRYVQRGMELTTVGSMTVMSVRANPLKSWFNRYTKRFFDVAVSSVFLCIYPLIYIPVAIAIKLSSRGPVYFRQERTGYHGRTFKCLKFRTMRSSAEANTRQATAGDPRVTRVGAFLRRTSIDELPQFINVWRGDMSIVGPRPHMLKHTDDYSKLIDRYMARHAVKPGITGWAQVTGLRGPTDELWKMEKRVEADVWYIEHWSLLLDLKIMIRTVINAFSGDSNAV